MTARVGAIIGLWCATFAAPAWARHWADSTGQFAIDADLVEVRGDNVVLKKVDGKLITVPISRLSADDQRFVASLPKSKQPVTASAPNGKPQSALVKAGREAIEAALAKPTKYDFHDTPLKDAIDFLAQQHQIEFYIDRKSFQDAGIQPDAPITAAGKGSLASALDSVLKPHHLMWTVHHDVLYVTTVERAETILETRVYRFLQPVTNFAATIDDIQTNVASASWAVYGGAGSIGTWPAGALVIAQTYENHRLLERRYAAVMRPVAVPKLKAVRGQGRNRRKGPWEALEQAVELDFVETPLSDVAQFISQKYKVKVSLDASALRLAGLNPTTPLTLHAHGVSLASALSLAAEPLGAAWTADENGVQVTSAQAARAANTPATYDVRDLLAANRGNSNDLVEIITSNIDPVSWAVAGGGGSISVVGGDLQVQNSFAVNRKIERLLSDLRQVGGGR